MATAFDHLIVITLFRGDVSQTGTTTHDVNHHAGQFGSGQVGQTLLFQADPRAGTGRHGPHTCPGSAIDHVDGCDLALGLQEGPTHQGHVLGSSMSDLTGRCDGISIVGAAPGQDGAFDNGFVAFY